MKRAYTLNANLTLALITLGAFALRAYHLEAQSLWYDEGVTAEIAQRSLLEITAWTANDIQPPLYYYVSSLWGKLAGWSEWSLRFPSVFFGTLVIPLLAACTFALTRNRSASILAGLFAALHPLLLYYSQEARMYMLLIALSITIGYLIVRLELADTRRVLTLVLYILAATAAIYTHYFAFFLLAALALALVISQLIVTPFLLKHSSGTAVTVASSDRRPSAENSNGQSAWALLGGFFLANVAVLALYLPWLSIMLRRLSLDASYWQGIFRLSDAARHVGVSFIGGETILEQHGVWLLLPVLIMSISLIPLLVWRRPAQIRTALYTLLWLVIPIVGVLALASMAPKFNARYVMIALPGLIIFWAASLSQWASGWRLSSADLDEEKSTLPRSLALLATAFLLALFVYADYNWFANSAFTKAEWRKLVQFVRENLDYLGDPNAEKNQIILTSGHAWPVWNYYAPDLTPLRMPEIEILDVNEVIDVAESFEVLQQALAGKEGAWLVEWQGEIVDPMGIVPLQLELSGEEARVKRKFWQLQLRHFTDINADALLKPPTGVVEPLVNFGNRINLVDMVIAGNDDLLLVWQVRSDTVNVLPDLYMVGGTSTADGLSMQELSDRRLASYEYPSFRWQPGQYILGRIPANEWIGPGALPNEYTLSFTVYDPTSDVGVLPVIDANGLAHSEQAMFDITLVNPSEGPDEMNFDTYVELAQEFFAELNQIDAEVVVGQPFAVEMRWYGEEKPIDDYQLLVRWRSDENGEIAHMEHISLSDMPTSEWPDDEQMRTLFLVQTSEDLSPGDYWLEFGLTMAEEQDKSDEFVGEHIRTTITVLSATEG